VIAGFADTPLFASERLRLTGKVLWYLMTIATLGIPLLLMLASSEVRRRSRRRHRHRELDSVNGKAESNGKLKSLDESGVVK
jgi:hypothetical protein